MLSRLFFRKKKGPPDYASWPSVSEMRAAVKRYRAEGYGLAAGVMQDAADAKEAWEKSQA